MAYIRQRKLRVGAESSRLGFSFRSLMGKDLLKIQKYFPQDYARIRRWFPLVDVSIIHHKMQRGYDGQAK